MSSYFLLRSTPESQIYKIDPAVIIKAKPMTQSRPIAIPNKLSRNRNTFDNKNNPTATIKNIPTKNRNFLTLTSFNILHSLLSLFTY